MMIATISPEDWRLSASSPLLIQLAILLASGPITRLIGTTGASVIGRIMGMLLAALAVSMVLGAVAEWLNLPAL